MANYKVTDTELTSIANAIRTKGGTQAQLEFPTGFVTAIGNIPSGGGSFQIGEPVGGFELANLGLMWANTAEEVQA